MNSNSSQRVIPFVGVLANERMDEHARSRFLSGLPFDIHQTSEIITFDHTDYYREEMGEQLLRWWFSLKSHWTETELPDRKRDFMSYEQTAAEQFDLSERPLNLDPGYLKENQVVLASTKYVAHRLCIGNEMYAELTLMYEDDAFTPLPWTYPDYRSSTARSFFRGVRDRFLDEIGKPRPSSEGGN